MTAITVGQYPRRVGISRRSVIIGSAVLGAGGGLGLWGLLADARVLPGRSVVDELFGRCDIASDPPEAEPGKVLKSSFFSAKRKRSVNYQLAYPPNAPPSSQLPTCLYLHGFGGNETEAFETLHLHRILAAAVAGGVPPFVIAAVNGGDRFWHPRADGDDPLGMIIDEFPGVLGQHGLPINRLAIMGTSMGGYGALLAATETTKPYLAAVATSAAVWHSFDEAQDVNPAAFDSIEDFRAYGDLRTRTAKLDGMAVRIDCGEADSFEPNLRSLAEQLPGSVTVNFAKGCHDSNFWRSVAPAQIAFVGTALTPPPAPAPPQ
jgi:hypothetical protein